MVQVREVVDRLAPAPQPAVKMEEPDVVVQVDRVAVPKRKKKEGKPVRMPKQPVECPHEPEEPPRRHSSHTIHQQVDHPNQRQALKRRGPELSPIRPSSRHTRPARTSSTSASGSSQASGGSVLLRSWNSEAQKWECLGSARK